MAEGRMIKKRVAKSKKLAAVSDSAALLWFMMYPHADVEGRMEACPCLIMGECIPYFNWEYTKVRGALNELHDTGLIVLYEANGNEYLEFTRFEDFQMLRKDREARSIIPKTPKHKEPQEIEERSGVTPEDSRLKLSKVKLSKVKSKDGILDNNIQYKEGKASPALQAAFDSVYKKGLNIYALLYKLKKQLKWGPGQEFPEDVLLQVCFMYEAQEEVIRKPWPWFVRVLRAEWENYNAAQNVKETDVLKKKGVPSAIAEIIKGIGG